MVPLKTLLACPYLAFLSKMFIHMKVRDAGPNRAHLPPRGHRGLNSS